ncbi:MAG: succinyl-diaminopimelate desuccinylase [Solirubrobacteraceae bacterium]|nr:succinyl-diaminopimelate desuccinylase [Solirubrobacteraceae bacterium]
MTGVIDRAGEVQNWVESRADEMAGLLTQLVAIETENPPGRGLGACASILRDALADLNLSPRVIPLASSGDLEDPCIVRAEAGPGSRSVYFHGHFDVVPAQRRDQFAVQRRDGRIIGRGTADMKGGLVSMIYGAAAAAELGLLGDGRIVLHFVCDEETGSAVGSGHLRQAGMIDPGAVAMLTPEPTGGVIWHASRGAITLRVRLTGREAHVGQAHLGSNAFEHMVRVAEPLNKLAHDLLQKRTEFPMADDAARGSMLVVGGSAASGAGFNVVPGRAWFSLDRRFNPEEDLDEEMDRLTDTVNEAAAAAGATVTIDVLQRQPSGRIEANHPVSIALSRCITAVEGDAPRFEVCPGCLDTRWYAQLGIPAYGYGAGRLDVSHGPDEFIDEAAMSRCATVYASFAGEMLQ